MSIQIISATPGPKTTERILELILAHPQGIATKELSDRLNRPVSMVNICLKSLIVSKQVHVKLSESGMQQIYYPKSVTVDFAAVVGKRGKGKLKSCTILNKPSAI
ncbi:winged helix-turn-helix transcriptional regulator [Candidatus Gracilibacteria bacterium]|nr:winged helix-turn-helix transcriptional regulator [Candidatus Gracilibacteria bacterium]NJM88884.1 winged helix-turn-helix transcriptional regulator [Hydrococcus sp. RU_2_2]NJP17840.1 winged helix-turn-helix transcriptional regulator [Hydrococcus sp. CRU_1_1]NJQ98540.1 winged helix-turn-helix transcriptional regulator [Hydrococcus sp. CSU_1_8]